MLRQLTPTDDRLTGCHLCRVTPIPQSYYLPTTQRTDLHPRSGAYRVTRRGVVGRSDDVGGMGHRNRQRADTQTRDHIARVRTTEATWLEFRRSLGITPVSHGLGQLVEAEVSRQRQRRVRHGAATDRELLDAIDDVSELHEQVNQLMRRLDERATPRQRTGPREEW